jgi:MFS family permease
LFRAHLLLARYRRLRAILPAPYWTVWVGTLINRAGGFVVPLLTFFLTDERGLTLTEAGAIVSLFGAGQVAAALVGGVLADQLGRRATMALSLLGGAAFTLALGFQTEPLAIAALTLCVGFVGELYRPAVQAFVADVVPAEHRLAAYGYLHWAINIGFSIAPLAAGLIAGWSYTALFVIDAATMAIYGVIVLARVPETRPARAAEAPRVGLDVVLRDRAFMIFWALTFITALVIFQSSTTLPGWMAAQGHGAGTFGAVIAVNGILIVLLQPVMTEALAGRSPARVLAAASLVTGAGFALHGTSALIVVHVAAVVLWTLGEIASSPTSSAVVANLAAPAARGRYQGVFTMSWGLASFFGPLVGPRILDAGGPWVLWGGCLVVGALAAAGFAATARRQSPRTA